MSNWIFLVIGMLAGMLLASIFIIGLHTAGYLVINTSNPKKDVFSFVGYNHDPRTYANKHFLVFKVVKSEAKLEEIGEEENNSA